jgi:predicted alpha/beta-fold hydrolase
MELKRFTLNFAARSAPLPVLLFLVFSANLHALDAPVAIEPLDLPSLPNYTPVMMSDLPDFKSECETKASKSGKVHCNGLLATINYLEFKKREPSQKPEEIKLSPEMTGFQKEIPVQILRQSGTAPLAVALLGFGQKCDDKIARAWLTYLFDSGCHVLIFDSLVRNNMNEATGHGVAGNFVEESKIACKLIDTVLKLPVGDGGKTLHDMTTSVRLLGTSYGGLLTAQCLRDPLAKAWPIDRALILSTPVNMRTAAQRLDTFAREDAPFYGIFDLMKLLGGYTPKGDEPNDQEQRLMRAGIGYVFHGDLQGYAKSNIQRYDPGLIDRLRNVEENPEQKSIYEEMIDTLKVRHKAEIKDLEAKKDTLQKDDYDRARRDLQERHKVQEIIAKRRSSEVDHWNFYDYVFLLLKPYWKLKHSDSTAVTIEQMLRGAPNYVQAFVAQDDPLNDPKELQLIQSRVQPPLLQVMPHGGHLGYTATKWVEELIHKMFKP